MKTKPVNDAEVKQLCSDPNLVTYCCFITRPGIYGWIVEVEYTKFKPDTDANEGFHLTFAKCPADKKPIPNLTMVMATFDKRQQEWAESILWKHGLRKVAPGFVPAFFGAYPIYGTGVMSPEMAKKSEAQLFFLQGPNIFYLENHSQGAPNVVYSNNPEKMAEAREHEMAQVKKFFDEHKRWIESPEGEAIANAYWKKHPEGHVR